MKRFFVLSLITSLILASFTFSPNDECDAYYLYEEGKTVELINYDHKDKTTGRAVHKVNKFTSTDNGFVVDIHTQQFDKKDKALIDNTFEIKCENGTLKIDMADFVDMSQIQNFEGMEIDIQTEKLTLPSNLSVGQTLDKGKITMSASNMGMKLFSQTVIIDNRKVEAFETKTCPAGTFECVKISYETRTQILGKALIYKNTDWLSKGIGIVRSETYKGDKLEGYTELNKID